MRDGRAPRGFAAASIKTPGLQGGTEERFAGYGVMGLPSRSGHYLALRNFPASSIGPGFRAVWHRDPHRRWTFYADAPAEVSCARYLGATSPGGAERVPIDVTWTGPRSLRVTVPDVLAWEVHLAATAATRLLSSASRLLPDSCWDSDRVLGAMGRVAGLLLRAGRVRLQGTVPNGEHFQAAPRLVWAVTNSTALVGGHDIGPPGPLPHQDRLGELWLPQRGLFTVGTVRFDTYDPTRHHPATNRLTGHEMSTKAVISIAEIPGTLRAGIPVRARRRPMIRGGIMDIVTVKQRQQAAWASGDYAAVGARFPIIAELLCESVDLRAGERVLDVACGNGNAALAAARRFCQVVGVDYVPALLDNARRRAEAEGLQATFQEGDAEALPFPDDAFDVVLSTCGAMFAPDQEQTASELLRVCRPGGRIGMVNWTPDSYVGELFQTIGRHLPPPPGVRPPTLWGSQERLHELFGPSMRISAPRRSFLWRFPSAEHQVEFFATFYGPTVKTLAAVGDRAAALRADMLAAARRFDVSEDGDTLVLRMDYLEAVIHKPAP